jgi:hypothetical protein
MRTSGSSGEMVAAKLQSRGLKPNLIGALEAALKRRSSTGVQSFVNAADNSTVERDWRVATLRRASLAQGRLRN